MANSLGMCTDPGLCVIVEVCVIVELRKSMTWVTV